MRIGLFGGTFDPIHCGHIRCALAVKDEFSLDLVLFIPSKSPVHKQGVGAGSEDRANMIELALDGAHGFELSRIELDRESPSYSVLTVREVAAKYPGADLFFMLGMDAFNTLKIWKEYRELMRMTSFIVMRRGDEVADEELVRGARRVCFAENELVDISSTEVRDRITSGESLDEIIPPAVLRYIREKRLYEPLTD